jgi:hypothetical protein
MSTNSEQSMESISLSSADIKLFQKFEESFKENPELRIEPVKTSEIIVQSSLNSSDGVFAETFWWGCRAVIPQEAILKAGGILNLAAAVGAAVSLILPPIATVISIYVSVQAGAIALVNRGKGVYLNMNWTNPYIIYPTAIE